MEKEKKKKSTFRKDKKTITVVHKKDKAKKPTNEIWDIWLKVGDEYDPVPYQVSTNDTIHDLKKKILLDDEFELSYMKLHKMRLLVDDLPLNPRKYVYEEMINGSEVCIHVPSVLPPGSPGSPRSVSMLSSRSPISPSGSGASASLTEEEVEVHKELKRDVRQLRRKVDQLKNQMSSSTDSLGAVDNVAIENAVKKSLTSAISKLDDMGKSLSKKQAEMDGTMKELHVMASTLKRVGGIPAVGNAFAPSHVGVPALRCKETLSGHLGPVWSLSKGSEMLFSGSSDTTVKVWDMNTNRAKHTLRGHSSIVHCVVASNDDKMVVSGSDDKTIKIWDVENLTCKKTIHDNNIACVLRVARGHLFSGSFKCVKVWNLEKGEEIKQLTGHGHWVRAIALSGGYCFSGGHNSIKMWDMGKFNEVRTMTQNCGSIYCIVVSGNMLYAGTFENTVNIWDLRSHEFVRSLPGHRGAVYGVAVGKNKIFSGSYDTTVRVWDIRTYGCVQSCVGHSSSVEALQLSAEGKLYSASTDNTIKLWNIKSVSNDGHM